MMFEMNFWQHETPAGFEWNAYAGDDKPNSR